MANVQHSTLTDPNIHEPKGVASATANRVYMSNGSGSGSWTGVNLLPGTGWGKYTNTTYVGTTVLAVSTSNVLIPFTTADTVTQLPITLAGATAPLMDLNTETLQFVSNGDLHTITFTAKLYSVTGSPSYMNILLYGSTNGVAYTTLLGDKTVTLSKGANQVIVETSLFPVTANMVSYGARLYTVVNAGTANLIDIGLITARVHKAR